MDNSANIEEFAQMLMEAAPSNTVVIVKLPDGGSAPDKEEEREMEHFNPFEDVAESHYSGGGGGDPGAILMGNPNQ